VLNSGGAMSLLAPGTRWFMVAPGVKASSATVSNRLMASVAGHDRATVLGLDPSLAPESQFRHGVAGRDRSVSVMVHVHHVCET